LCTRFILLMLKFTMLFFIYLFIYLFINVYTIFLISCFQHRDLLPATVNV
jgi:hypothetical protein